MTSDAHIESSDEAASVIPAQITPSALDRKILQHFPGLVVRKDLTNGLKQNAVVPTYVLEYLLGQHCATDNPAEIATGLESVKRILAKHYVHRNQAELIKSTIKEKGKHKVIDKLTVELNDKAGFYEAEFTNLGLKKVPISDDFVRRYPKLLVGGIWCIIDVIYALPEDPKASPWQVDTLKPIQVANASIEEFLAARAEFTTEEWMDVLMQSMGFNPAMFTRRAKLLTLMRLIPYCERNYNLLELGPKGTGKSHVYAEFSPHGMLISGSEITAPKLFVSNASGKIGLVGYWDCICFDEFAGKDKRVDKALVDIMKNYMANRSFSRGVEQLTAEASIVFMGNTQKSVEYMQRHSHFFEPLPDKYIDSAFLDRMHAYIPGWEVSPVRHELFTSGYGFVVDYLAEILKHLRTEDYTGAYKQDYEVTSEVSTRDQTGFEKTFSGMMKVLFPNGKASSEEIRELLSLGMEMRRRVREHIVRIDETFVKHAFSFAQLGGGGAVTIYTPEELLYPPKEANLISTGESVGESRDSTPEQAPAAAQEARRTVLGYEVLKRITGGGMAECYHVRESNGETRFLKAVPLRNVNADALKREQAVYDKLERASAKHVLRVYAFPRDDEQFGIVTEYADGGSLEDFHWAHPNPEPGDSLEIAQSVAEGIRELHELGIVHRDLKPQNILRSGGLWKIADFGISKRMDRPVTQGQTFQGRGTAGYTPQEQWKGNEATYASDVYAFGKIMTFLLTDSTDLDRLYPMAPTWASLITSCCATDPEERPTIEEVIRQLGQMRA